MSDKNNSLFTRFEDIQENMEASESYTITSHAYEAFLNIFQDRNVLHTNSAYAISHGFKDKVMHGGILNGFVSHFIGMRFPGERSLLLSTELSFLKPCFLNDKLELTAKVAQKLECERILHLHIYFKNQSQNYLAAKGRANVKIL